MMSNWVCLSISANTQLPCTWLSGHMWECLVREISRSESAESDSLTVWVPPVAPKRQGFLSKQHIWEVWGAQAPRQGSESGMGEATAKARWRWFPPRAGNPRGKGAGVFMHQRLSVSRWAEPGREVLGPQHFWPTMLVGGSGKRCWWPEVNRSPPKW